MNTIISTNDGSVVNNYNIHVSNHPVISHKISILRSSASNSATFRSTVRELTNHIGFEATSKLATKPIKITIAGPSTNDVPESGAVDHMECIGDSLSERVCVVPILRSGLGMCDAMLELVPHAAVHHIGMYQTETMPVQYFNRLPKRCEADVAYILDPMIADARTIISVIGILKRWGVPRIHLVSIIASQDELKRIVKSHPDVEVNIGAVDKKAAEDGNIIQGIGDTSARLFGPPLDESEEILLHPSKRKRYKNTVGKKKITPKEDIAISLDRARAH